MMPSLYRRLCSPTHGLVPLKGKQCVGAVSSSGCVAPLMTRCQEVVVVVEVEPTYAMVEEEAEAAAAEEEAEEAVVVEVEEEEGDEQVSPDETVCRFSRQIMWRLRYLEYSLRFSSASR